MDAPATVLVIDDDDAVRDIVRTTLEREHIEVLEATSGGPGLRKVFGSRPDVVVLDLEMPGLDGWRTLRTLREVSDSVAVLILSAHDETSDRVRGLRGGADDFLGKPFEPRELAARVQALLRRSRAHPGLGAGERIDTGYVVMDTKARRVTCGAEEVELTALEYRLLEALVRRPGAACSSDDLVQAVWGQVDGVDAMGQLNVLVSRLRRKLGTDPATGASPVETIRGFGYRLAASGFEEGA
mgnify:FL=1